MLTKKKKAFILAGMVLLLAVTGTLNWFLNTRPDQAIAGGGEAQGQGAGFFATFRRDREASRLESVMHLRAIIDAESSSQEARDSATAAIAAMAVNIELELVLEGMIRALGFADVVVTNSTENVNVIVQTQDNLIEAEVARILDLIVTETQRAATSVRIVPVR